MVNHLTVCMRGAQKMVTIPKHSNVKTGDKIVISKVIEEGDEE